MGANRMCQIRQIQHKDSNWLLVCTRTRHRQKTSRKGNKVGKNISRCSVAEPRRSPSNDKPKAQRPQKHGPSKKLNSSSQSLSVSYKHREAHVCRRFLISSRCSQSFQDPSETSSAAPAASQPAHNVQQVTVGSWTDSNPNELTSSVFQSHSTENNSSCSSWLYIVLYIDGNWSYRLLLNSFLQSL